MQDKIPHIDPVRDISRVDFKPAEMRRLIDQKGYLVSWSRWAPCPCLRDESRQFKIDCPLCHNRGDRFVDEVQVKAIVTSLGAQTEFRDFSPWNIGTASLTLMEPDRFIGMRDKFVLVDSVSTNSEVALRDADAAKTQMWLHYPLLSVVSLFKLSADGTAYQDLTEGADFRLSVDGALEWLDSTGNPPAPGTMFSVVYTYRPTYQVIEILNDVRMTSVRELTGAETLWRLPQRAMVKRSHLIAISQVEES